MVILESKEALIKKYLQEVLNINSLINLTRITDPEEANILHIQDSLAALPEINAAPAGLYGDLGSGGGFPGVPLGIYSERDTVLFDSIQKKMSAVDSILQSLNISTISVYPGRIEEYCGPLFSVVTARALSSLPSLLELASPLLTIGGHLVALKSHVEDNEKNQALTIQDLVGMNLKNERSFTIGDDIYQRQILVFEKTHEPTISLPRRVGKAQKSPLKA